MILDAVSFREMVSGTDTKNKALRALTDFLEERLGVHIVRDLRGIPYGQPELAQAFDRAALLRKHGVIKEFGRAYSVPDEPPARAWYTICNVDTNHQTGGTSWDSDENAFYAAISEGLERYIWMTQSDYFINPKTATVADIAKSGRAIAPEDIVGYTEEQRATSAQRTLRSDAEYLWIQGVSLTDGKRTYLPAQIVTGIGHWNWQNKHEPIIRQQNTNGLATWQRKAAHD